jgi:DNA-directed RNA polymerase specialized sigma24 family protein
LRDPALEFALMYRNPKEETMSNSTRAGWFMDLEATCDEVLLLLAREARCRAAGDELTCRYWRQFQSAPWRNPAARGLSPWDLEDAQQQAYFWIREAIGAYDSGQLALAQGTSFRTFLQRVVQRRLLDFGRSLKRNRKHDLAALGPDRLQRLPAEGLSAGAREDLHARLARAVSSLDPPMRALWDELCRGRRLRDLADVLAVSYRTLKRRWRKLREQLARACPLLEQDANK